MAGGRLLILGEALNDPLKKDCAFFKSYTLARAQCVVFG
jgi:hypothetical protein